MQGTDLAKEGRAWRLLVDTPAGGAYNMAADEAILLSHARGKYPHSSPVPMDPLLYPQAILRIYLKK